MNNNSLDEIDRLIIEKSKDLQVTKNRTLTTVVVGFLFLIFYCGAVFVFEDRMCLLLIGGVYILITIFEKYSYGQTVLLYKKLIQKLSFNTDDRGTEPRQTTKP